jgi:hypothetical protein
MQEVLVDGGKFVFQDEIEMTDDFGVALHRGDGRGAYAARSRFDVCARVSSRISPIVSWHRPQFLFTPHRA